MWLWSLSLKISHCTVLALLVFVITRCLREETEWGRRSLKVYTCAKQLSNIISHDVTKLGIMERILTGIYVCIGFGQILRNHQQTCFWDPSVSSWFGEKRWLPPSCVPQPSSFSQPLGSPRPAPCVALYLRVRDHPPPFRGGHTGFPNLPPASTTNS